MNRKEFIQRSATFALGVSAFSGSALPGSEKRMGVSVASYAIRWKSSTESKAYAGFENALDLLDHCHQLGAGGLQVGVRNWTADFAGKVRTRREKLDLYLEGQITLPKQAEDIPRFEGELLAAKEAGAVILRAVCLRGRRYETFNSLDAFQKFKKASLHSLMLAEPVVRKHRVKLAIENHKDWLATELLEVLKKLDSEWVGVTLDMGNNISMLEDPMQVVLALAPFTFTTHFKDMAYEEYEEGFLLSEVPLGQGMLDLPEMIRICRQYNSEVTFNLEMITRDPLKIPCLTDQYWATFDQSTGRDLARTLSAIRQQSDPRKLPEVSTRNGKGKLAFEEENVQESFDFAREELGFA